MLKEQGNILDEGVRLSKALLEFCLQNGFFISLKTGGYSKTRPERDRQPFNDDLVNQIHAMYLNGDFFAPKFYDVVCVQSANHFREHIFKKRKMKLLSNEEFKKIYEGDIREFYSARTEKTRQTNLEKYGAENVFQSEEIKEKIKQTNLEKYGVENPGQSPEIREKVKATNLEKFGVENVFQSEEIKEKIKQTLLKNYGVEHPTQSPEIRKRVEETNLRKFGVKYNLSCPEFRVVIKQTMLEKYGVENPGQSPEIRKKVEATNLKKFGVKCTFESPEIQSKSRKTNLDRYGVPVASVLPEVKEKMVKTNLRKYGVEFTTQYAPVREKSHQTRKTNDARFCGLCDILECGSNEEISSFLRKNYTNSHACQQEIKLGIRDKFQSGPEKMVHLFLDSLGIQYEANKRPAFMQGLELDIWIPDHNVAIEINGIYWHSSAHKDRFYHQNKKKLALQANVSLMMFTDEQIFNRFDIIKSIIKHRLKLTETKISARKCKIQEISTKEAQAFLEANHLDGYVPAKLNLGLFHGSELIQVCTFSKSRFDGKTNNHELIRMATKVHCCVRGGFDKLIKHFKANYLPEGANLISFVNANYYDGNSYGTIGVCGEEMTSPDLWFVYEGQLMSRQKFMKHNLHKLFPEFPQRGSLGYEEITVSKFLEEKDVQTYHGCGNFKFLL